MSSPSVRGQPRGDSFGCTRQQLDGAVVCFVLSGELDLASVDTFRSNLNMAAHDANGILLDVRDLRYIDSSGVNALLDAYRVLAPSGRRIALVGASANILRIFSVLHLEDLMPAFPSVDEALTYLHSGGRSDRPLAEA